MTSKNKISALLTCAIVLCLSLSSCLKDSDSAETIITDYQNATVKTFSFADNNDVCKSLSSYKFTIDNFGQSDPELASKMPNAGIIFNPDSLPVGTEPDSIKIEMTLNNASSAIFTQYDRQGFLAKKTNYKDTQYVFFKDYSVTRLDIVSYDKSVKKSYFIKVNVHKVYGDTIRWQYKAQNLWDTADIVSQKTVELGNNLLWFSEYGDGSVKLAKAEKATPTVWSEQQNLAKSFAPQLQTITTWSNNLVAVAKDGTVMMSEDGEIWNKTNKEYLFVSILGVQLATKKHGEYLHAIVKSENAYHFAGSHDGISWVVGDVIPENFPIKDFSNPISDEAKPSAGNITSRLYIVGGETADGQLTSSTWSCDGTSWAEFKQGFLLAMKSAAIVEYALNADTPKSFWMLWPGVMSDGKVSNTIYFSQNKGVTWKPMTSEFAKYAKTENLKAVGSVSAYMDENNYWMYFFGGTDAEGQQQANIFGGQLQSLTFKKKK